MIICYRCCYMEALKRNILQHSDDEEIVLSWSLSPLKISAPFWQSRYLDEKLEVTTSVGDCLGSEYRPQRDLYSQPQLVTLWRNKRAIYTVPSQHNQQAISALVRQPGRRHTGCQRIWGGEQARHQFAMH